MRQALVHKATAAGGLPRFSVACQHAGHRPRARSVVRAQEQGDGPDGSMEDLFAQELKRRGMERNGSGGSSTDSAEPSSAKKDTYTTTTTSKSPFESSSQAPPRASKAPPAETDGQRERSFALVNEGLEGLIPRASELIKLGGGLFLAFLPFMAAFSLLFSLIYWSPLGGDKLIHGGGAGSGPPAYVSPEQLLSEPTVDPYIPY